MTVKDCKRVAEELGLFDKHDDEKLIIEVEGFGFFGLMHPDATGERFNSDEEQIHQYASQKHGAPFHVDLVHWTGMDTQAIERKACEQAAQKFNDKVTEVYEQMDSLEDVLKMEA